MSLQSYLAELKDKPEAHRRQVSLWVSLSITALVAVIWAVGFRYLSVGNDQTATKTAQANSPIKEISTAIGGSLGQIIDNVTGAKSTFLQGVSNTDAGGSETTAAPSPTLGGGQ